MLKEKNNKRFNYGRRLDGQTWLERRMVDAVSQDANTATVDRNRFLGDALGIRWGDVVVNNIVPWYWVKRKFNTSYLLPFYPLT